MAVAADGATTAAAEVGLEDPETDTTKYKILQDKEKKVTS
jgi:hypothetical protein